MIDRPHLSGLLSRERASYVSLHPRSLQATEDAGALLAGVPMTWMGKWPGGFPLVLDRAVGASLRDLDGLEYADFCLGDTGAMAGHSPAPTVAAIRHRVEDLGGLTAMLPSADGPAVARILAERFGVARWSFTLTATDANRCAVRIARHVTARPKILVFNYCYHGSVDETVARLDESGRGVVASPGNVGAPVDLALTTRVVEFNDVEALESELAQGDVAAVLAEPALTNIGIVLPSPGFHDAVRALTRRAGALLIIDETHTLSAGPGGCTAAWKLEPDIVTLGKAIAGGIPAGAYGLTSEVARRLMAAPDADLVDVGGVGGTLAGNALSTAAMRATLESVLTQEAFDRMTALMSRYEVGGRTVIERCGLPWTMTRLGARAEYRFCSPAPRSGAESAAAEDPELEEYLHLSLANRGVLLTPFHNMALACPATTEADVDRLLGAFTETVEALVVPPA